MKNLHIFLFLFLLSACNSGGPGTLGVSDEETVNCPFQYVDKEIAYLLTRPEFEIPAKDSTAVNWWSESGYDFLNHRCLTVDKRLYMITIHSEGSDKTAIAVRAVYAGSVRKWRFAADFDSKDNSHADKAFDLLMHEIEPCL